MFKKISFIHYALFILSIGALLVLLLRSRHVEPLVQQVLVSDTVRIPVSIADTPAKRQQGLSDTTTLPADRGMLFVFDTPGNYAFWMKDMHYDLDMVWMDANMTVVDITKDVSVESYPQLFRPHVPAQYVLEANKGFSDTHGITVGEKFKLQY